MTRQQNLIAVTRSIRKEVEKMCIIEIHESIVTDFTRCRWATIDDAGKFLHCRL
jgi:hypothetical protein